MFVPIVTSLPHNRAGKVQVHRVTGTLQLATLPPASIRWVRGMRPCPPR